MFCGVQSNGFTLYTWENKYIPTDRRKKQSDLRTDKGVYKQTTSSGLRERQMFQEYFMFPYVFSESRIVNRE